MRPGAALLIAGLLLVSGCGSRPRVSSAGSSPLVVAAPVAAPPRGVPVSVSISGRPAGARVPSDFLGLSVGVAYLPRVAREATSSSGDLVALLRSLGPGVLRFSETNWAGWSPEGARAPRWEVVRIGPSDFDGLARLARETGWRFLLSVNLAHFDPGSAAQEAAAAESILGTSLAGIEIGNEPDRYPVEGLRPASWWSFDAYRHEVDAYRSAIDDAAPGVPIAGPDASSGEPPLSWVRDEGRLAGPSLLTDHYYPLTLCGGTTVALGDLVSASTRASESAMLAQLVSLQRVSGIPLRLDETNNVSCKGAPGVSSTFAAALWAADFIGRAARAGLAGVNLMDRLERVVDPATGAYSPLALTDEAELRSGRLHVYPEWYALLLTRSLAGTRPLGTRVLGAGRLTASAFLGADGSVQVLLVDFDPPGARGLRVRVSGAWRAGTVLRLTASSLGARGGVTLGRRSVGADGAWAPVSPLPRVYVSGGRSELSVAPSSAALVTLYR